MGSPREEKFYLNSTRKNNDGMASVSWIKNHIRYIHTLYGFMYANNLSFSHSHAHMHAHVHTHAHTHIHTYTHAHMCTHTLIHYEINP